MTCTYRMRDLVGRASIRHDAIGRSTPATRTPTLQMTRVWPARKRSKIGFAVLARRQPVHVFGCDADFLEALVDVLRMLAVDAERQRRPVLAALQPLGDDVAGDRRAIHRFRKLVFLEVAGDGRDGRQIGIARRIDRERREKAVADQIGRGRRDDQVVVIFA